MSRRLHRIAICLVVMHAGLAHAAEEPAAPAAGQQIARAGSQPSAAGPDAFFTERVRVDPLWPAGSGIDSWGKPLQEHRPRDVVWCPPGVKHWHEASLTTAMTHLSVAGAVDGRNVKWMEKVSDDNAR